MATIDLTGKLGLGKRPAIEIDGERYEVDNSAKSILQLMALVEDGVEASDIPKAYELLFDAPTRKRLDKLNLPFEGFVQLINAAVQLVSGDEQGEAETPAIP